MGKKDIIKIEGPLDIDLNVLGVLDPNLTINIIKDNNIVAKHKLELPETVTGIIRCKNPRCITSIEQELPHSFKLTDRNRRIYRCIYCDSKEAWSTNRSLFFRFVKQCVVALHKTKRLSLSTR